MTASPPVVSRKFASQARAWLNANSGCLRNDDGAPVSDTLAAVGASGQAAVDAALLLARHLGQLQSALAAIGNRTTPAEGEDRD